MPRNGRKKQPSVKRYRLRNSLTQQQLADQIGINRSTVAWLESSPTRRPGWNLAAKIAALVGRSPGQIMDEYSERRAA